MKNLYTLFVFLLFTFSYSFGQPCSSLLITSAVPSESRCMATGTIQVQASGGTGNYNYKVDGPVSTPFTSSSLITGLSAGVYSVTVRDVTTGCEVRQDNISVTGSYTDPRFALSKSDVTCLNASDGTISVQALVGGRSPYTFTIVSPSAAGVGTSNNTGVFTGLPGGEYNIQLTDSCGGIQTRRINVLDYNWWIEVYNGNKLSCDDIRFFIGLRDSRGNLNTSGTAFSAFQYGVINSPGDTSWYSSSTFDHGVGRQRFVNLAVKDGCGNVRTVRWFSIYLPSVGSIVTTTQQACNSFTATISSQTNLTNPQFCLYNSSSTLLSCNATGIFSGLSAGAYTISIKDDCFDTTINRTFTVSQPIPSLSPNVNISRVDCNSVNVNVAGLSNFTNPEFCLYDQANNLVGCNSNGSFPGLTNGSYCIRVKDGCYDTTITRCFTIAPLVPSVNASITIGNRYCEGFDFSIGGQTNLFNPDFCLYTEAGVLVGCNSTGNFGNINYGSYCLRISNDDNCYDTTIVRCFTVLPELPNVAPDLNATRYCTTVDISVGWQTGFYNPQYCLYNSANQLVACNATGLFTNLPYGTYCMDIINGPDCFDTTIRRCITIVPEQPSVGAVILSNTTCTGFTATVDNQVGLSSPQFRLKDGSGNIIQSNTSGVFSEVPYGSYCIDIQNNALCFDTVITRCFQAVQPVPSAGNVSISGRSCSGFNARVDGVVNFTNPLFELLDANNQLVGTNSTGVFNSLPYGSYCVNIRDNCYDTTLTRCFSAAPRAIALQVSATPSCIMGATSLRVFVQFGTGPYAIRVFDSTGNQLASANSSSPIVWINNIQTNGYAGQLRVVLTDNCGNSSTRNVMPVISALERDVTITPKCPSGAFQDGSAELTIRVQSNLGTITPVIIQHDGVNVSIPYNNTDRINYTWNELAPGSYIIRYDLPSFCSNKYFDTIRVNAYQYPRLDKSAIYQCDNNSFTVNADVKGGNAPFLYEIIGSVPAVPSIIAPPQASPVFTIDNGNIYSLVRLRVVDQCGNATLNDVSVLPLQNTVVTSTADCYYADVTLTVDSVPNASYTWYKKLSETDSVEVGNARVFEIPYLTPAEIGTYVSKISVGNGCLTRLNYFSVTGQCGGVLEDDFKLKASKRNGVHVLNWKHISSAEVNTYQVERLARVDGIPEVIGEIRPANGWQSFSLTDQAPLMGANYYRVKVIGKNGKVGYSNLVKLDHTGGMGFSVYPNPVRDVINIRIAAASRSGYDFKLFSSSGQLVMADQKVVEGSSVIQIRRTKNIRPGIYLLRISNTTTGEVRFEKLLFE
ncbi:T9SS type A sorting domain-containing protein [Flavihumibacter rivuli]|uniref:T9SS type A sorting domain-containing protein n=1 Tax=Flavihumibacter rivuli TaxID=2838156 RepID=UPI001BDE59E2|nr:T9SS type A sorting domain-containing protein [Flavihumibacter rivuli]ULQ58007.1 T9SS type A sorting domain-containing protein [Flavihumibacter rivuli]